MCRHRIACFITDNRGAKHIVNTYVIALRQRDQKAENGASQMDDAGVRSVIKIQSMSIQAIEKDSFL